VTDYATYTNTKLAALARAQAASFRYPNGRPADPATAELLEALADRVAAAHFCLQHPQLLATTLDYQPLLVQEAFRNLRDHDCRR